MKKREVRVVLAGCQKLAVDVLDFIYKGNEAVGIDSDGYAVCPKLVGVITHDEERDRLLGDTMVADYCDANGIPNIRFDSRVQSGIIKSWNPDIIFSIYYRKILPKNIIDIPRLGCVNIHPANLPNDRGPNPTLWVVRRGDYSAFTTLHYIDEGMDTGDIITSKATGITGKTGFEVNVLMMDVGFEMFKENYEDIMCERNKRFPQNHRVATCNIPFENSMRYINWNQDPSAIANHVRAFARPYPGAIAKTKGGLEITVNKIIVLDKTRSSSGPGAYEKTCDGIMVQTYSKPILIVDYVGPDINKGRFV